MAFVYDNTVIVSFADFQDVLDHDQRLFDTNEGIDESVVTPLLVRATERIVSKIKGSDWWKSVTPPNTTPDTSLIVSNFNDFSDLCVYVALSEYVLPIIADFGDQDTAEYMKLKYYESKAETLLNEIISGGGWYDFNNDGQISNSEIKRGNILKRRVR